MSLLRPLVLGLFVLSVLVATPAAKKSAPRLPDDPRDIPYEARLLFTKSKADFNGDGRSEGIVIVSALTGKDKPEEATEVIVAIVGPSVGEERGPLLWVRRVSAATGMPARGGEITAVDLDGDGGAELVLTFERSLREGAVDRWAEIYAIDELTRPRRIWEGAWRRDTRRDKTTPEGEREWFEREIDYGSTRKQAGRALILETRYGMLAGKILSPKKVVKERVDARLRSSR